MNRRSFLLTTLATSALASCQDREPKRPPELLSSGYIEVIDPSFHDLIDSEAAIEIIGSGYKWAEGPAWDSRRNCLYFSDIPNNRILRWTAALGPEDFFNPAGNPHKYERIHTAHGTNGLAYIAETDALIITNQDARSLDLYDFATQQRHLLADTYQGKRFNSPNDVVRAENGSVFFTDPPYGHPNTFESDGLEIGFQGVYCRLPRGEIKLISDRLKAPNGIALSPDQSKLYVSQSLPVAPIIQRFSKMDESTWQDDGVFFDFTSQMADNAPGLPDGMDVDVNGNLFATGPGGVTIISQHGQALGRINTGQATANCCFGEDGSTLFMTAHDKLLKVETKTRGIQFG